MSSSIQDRFPPKVLQNLIDEENLTTAIRFLQWDYWQDQFPFNITSSVLCVTFSFLFFFLGDGGGELRESFSHLF